MLAIVAAHALVGATAASATGPPPNPSQAHEGSRHQDGVGESPGMVQRDLAQVRAAVARYHTPERAQAAGWQLLSGLDHCFGHPGAGGMGVHYIDPVQLDNGTLDPRRPEALVFVPGPQGELRLGAVEYIVPIDDPADPGEPPSVLGHDLHELEPAEEVHVWGLRVWLFEPDPAGCSLTGTRGSAARPSPIALQTAELCRDAMVGDGSSRACNDDLDVRRNEPER